MTSEPIAAPLDRLRDVFASGLQSLSSVELRAARLDDLDLVADALAEREERIATLEDALSLPLMFHAGGPWDAVKRKEWLRIAGAEEATSRVMCDAVRRVLGMPKAPREAAPRGT